MRRSFALVAIFCAPAVASCGGDDEAGTPARTDEPAASAPAPGCEGVEAPSPKGEQSLKAPQRKLDPRRTHVVTLETNCGDIEITLDVERAPRTSASFASLVERDFYDGLTFHRVARDPGGGDFVIQGGDPLGNGQGGPGYSVREAPPRKLRYTRGVVAMAKTEVDPVGASGSQFYIVTAEDAGLPAIYALLGQVTGGDDAVARIAAARTDASDVPLSPVVIRDARLTVR